MQQRKRTAKGAAKRALADLHKALFVAQLLVLAAAAAAGGGAAEAKRVLLWVDDHPENNRDEMAKYGGRYEIEFRALVSTTAVREHLATHDDDLRARSAATFRLITDRHRDDEPDGQAGANLIRWLRSNGWSVPGRKLYFSPFCVNTQQRSTNLINNICEIQKKKKKITSFDQKITINNIR